MTASRRIIKNENILLHWPQLPKRSKKERMIEQTFAALSTPEDDFAKGSATGWNAMWRLIRKQPRAWLKNAYFKTQLAGPITLFGKLQAGGLSPSSQKANEQLLLHKVTLWLRHAYWQIDIIRDMGFKPIVVLDEPLLPNYMGQSGSTQARKTLKLLRSIVRRLQRRGAKVGIHCCNRVSPGMLLELGLDLVHFDVYHFPSLFSRAREDLQKFLRDGGIVAWGIVPVTETLNPADHTRIEKDLNNILLNMESRGLPLRRVLAQSMVAPTCGTGLLSTEQSEKIMNFTTSLSRQLKSRYRLDTE